MGADTGQQCLGTVSTAAADCPFSNGKQEEVVILPQAYALARSVACWSPDDTVKSCVACSV